MRGELKLFQRFNQMIDSHYHQHWTVPDYASELHLTESRLTDICRRFANRPPKRLIFDRSCARPNGCCSFPTARSTR
jgi:AraC family 4-hydroxyphenylacetate 3-monooxygenase operon regulatory protein